MARKETCILTNMCMISSDEGEVFWIRPDELASYALADGFETMYEVFASADLSENYHWFEDGEWKVRNR